MQAVMSTNGLKRQLENWKEINWRKVNKLVKNLRHRIFRARELGNFRKLRNLQKLIQKSYANLLLSVRRITQTNKGKATAGIDKEIINTPEQRVILVNNWKGGNLQPTKRVEILKANGKKRPLGIPTIFDRTWQCLVKYALEPAHEATFHKNSYGFRIGRSAHDCQKLIFDNLNSRVNGLEKQILELDIEKCFDRINHNKLMELTLLPINS